MPVPASALAAARDDDLLVRLIKIGQPNLLFRVRDNRAGRNTDDQVVAALAGHFLPHARLAGARFPVMLTGEVEQRVLVGIRKEDDGPAVAAVAAVRAAFWDILLAAK